MCYLVLEFGLGKTVSVFHKLVSTYISSFFSHVPNLYTTQGSHMLHPMN